MNAGMPTWPSGEPESSSRSKRGGIVLAIVLVIAIVSGVLWWRQRTNANTDAGRTEASHAAAAAALADSSAHAPAGVRITIRVVNATNIKGLAKRATTWLRDFGYDVVDFDSAPKQARTESLIEVHTGHDDWGERVRKALGTGRVTARPDTLRYVDLTVLVGSDWQPPPESFRP